MVARTPGAIFSRRLCEAAGSSVALQIVFSRAVALAFKLDFLHPATWLSDSVDAFNLLNLVQLSLVTAAQAYIFASTCIAAPRQRFSRFRMLLDLFTLQNIAFAVLYALTGYFTLGFYTSALNERYASLKKICTNSEGQCLVEESLFLECGGLWLGLYFFLKTHIFGSPILIFPHIHQEKIHQIRSAVFRNVIEGFKDSLKPTLYFIMFYVFWGHKPRSVVADVYSLYLEDAPLDKVINLLSSGVWLSLWLYSSLFFISMYNMKIVFVAFLTEPVKFPVNSATSVSLLEALSLRWTYTGLLAAKDFRQMANADVVRRSEVFTVSLPGGHPRTWNALLNECLLTIDTFSEELEAISNAKPQPESPVKPAVQFHYQCQPMIRNMASPQLEIRDNSRTFDEKVIDIIRTVARTQIQKLMQKPGVNYMFKEIPDWKLRSLLDRAQPVMWTCEGLASISAASLHEDKYGIVQNDLHIIIASLMRLKQNLDKLTKSGLLPKKHSADVFTSRMKTALLSSARRSIYKITHTFSRYMKDISLSSELAEAVKPYLEFKEC